MTYYLRHSWGPGYLVPRFEGEIATILVYNESNINVA
jgi:hypothetical protein